VGNPEGRSYLKDPGLDGVIILKWLCKSMNWIYLAQDRDW
jgi:hypothetical protein